MTVDLFHCATVMVLLVREAELCTLERKSSEQRSGWNHKVKTALVAARLCSSFPIASELLQHELPDYSGF